MTNPDLKELIGEIEALAKHSAEMNARLQAARKSAIQLQSEIENGAETPEEKPAEPNKNLTSEELKKSVQSIVAEKFKSENDIWIHPIKEESIPYPFVSIEERKARGSNTRFISFINFKGGVGKTTLAANLAAAFASGNYNSPDGEPQKKPLRVLVVDLDFQGTLSDRCAANMHTLHAALREQRTAAQLLFTPKKSPHTLEKLALPFVECEHAKIIPGDHLIDFADNKSLLFQTFDIFERRFEFRCWFHCDYVFENFDLVIFDCPPRKTASSINAMACSDFVFLPTCANDFDAEGIYRMIEWFVHFAYNLRLPTAIGGVVFNRINTKNKMSGYELNVKDQIVSMIQTSFQFAEGGDAQAYKTYENQHGFPSILNSFIPKRSGSNSINGSQPEALNGSKRFGNLFVNLATEIYGRIYQ